MEIVKAIEGVVKNGLEALDRVKVDISYRAEQAARVVAEARAEIEGLIRFAEDVPRVMLDRYSVVATGNLQCLEPIPSEEFYLDTYQGRTTVRSVAGEARLQPGKYRVILLIEKVD